MDELESRLAAVEGLLLEWLALTPPTLLMRLTEIVGTWDEPEQRGQALQLIEDALRRYDEFTQGIVLRGPPEE